MTVCSKQSQQWGGTKQLSETLSLNKVQDKTGDVAHRLGTPEFSQSPVPKKGIYWFIYSI